MLSGFLGAGKPMLLNPVTANLEGLGVAVIDRSARNLVA